MKTIFNGNNILLKWYFTDAITGTDFSFDNADTRVVLYSHNYRMELNHSIEGNIIQSNIPSHLPFGVYSLECTYWVGIGAKRANVVIHEAFQVTRNTGALVEHELKFYSVTMPIFTTKIATVEYVTEKLYKELETSQSLGKRTLYVVITESGEEKIYLYNKPLGGVDEEFYVADEEDITLAQKADGTGKVYRFKDRDTSKGMGYVILRSDKTLAEQIISDNTIYEVRYDFDLNGEEITIPEDCVLDFKGGSLNNGYVALNDNITVNNGIFHDVIITSSSNNIEFKNCDFEGGTINNSGTSYTNGLLSFDGSNNISIQNCKFHDGRLGLYCFKVNNIKVVNTVFERMSYWANYFSSVKGLLFDGCYSSHNGEDGIKLTGEIGDVIISNNESCYNGQDGIDFAGHSCYNVSIINNIFHDNEINGITFKSLDKELYPIDRWGLVDSELLWMNINISNNNICNNNITAISHYHYYAGTMGERYRNFSISNNIIFSNIGASTGIHASANTNVYHGVVISNNHIRGDFDYGATLSNARYYLFKNNDIYVDNIGLRIDKQNYNGEPILNDIIYNTIQAYRNYGLFLYEDAKYNNVKYNHIRSSKKESIYDLGENNVAFNYRLDFKAKNTMTSSLTDLKAEDALYNALNKDSLKVEYWNGFEWINCDGTLKSKVKFI